ncbi:hypothetical protein D3C75_1304230 [compost metagenome]
MLWHAIVVVREGESEQDGAKFPPASYFLYCSGTGQLLFSRTGIAHDTACGNDADAIFGGVFRHQAAGEIDQKN